PGLADKVIEALAGHSSLLQLLGGLEEVGLFLGQRLRPIRHRSAPLDLRSDVPGRRVRWARPVRAVPAWRLRPGKPRYPVRPILLDAVGGGVRSPCFASLMLLWRAVQPFPGWLRVARPV